MSQADKSGMGSNQTLGAALRAQARARGHAPLLTYYGATAGDRTELSFATFENWASKTANLFTEELGLRRGGRVALGLTDHWIGSVVAAAAWQIGAVVAFDVTASADVVVVAQAAVDQSLTGHAGLVVVGAGIAGRVVGDAPGLPYGDEVLAFADDYDDAAVSAQDPAVAAGSGLRTHADLAAEATASGDDRLLVTATLDAAMQVVTVPLVTGASVVWCPLSDPATAHTQAAQERCTHTLDGGAIRPL